MVYSNRVDPGCWLVRERFVAGDSDGDREDPMERSVPKSPEATGGEDPRQHDPGGSRDFRDPSHDGAMPNAPWSTGARQSSQDADNLDDLEIEITRLAAHIHAATHRLLTLIAEFDRRDGWKAGGHRSCAHWLHFATGIDLGAAREKVRTARALESLPETSASKQSGRPHSQAIPAGLAHR